MRRFLLICLMLAKCCYAQVTTSPSVSGVAGTGVVNGGTINGTAGQTYTLPTTSASLARTDIGQTFNGNQIINNGASNAGLTLITSAGNNFILFQPQNTHYNWQFAVQNNVNNGWEITPSTLVGGSSYTTPSISGNQAGGIFMPGLASSSVATTGTVCWTTGTGLLNVDTTVACLASARRFKQNIVSLDKGIAAVMALKPVSYELKPEFDPEHLGRQVGLIAEEVDTVDPRLVGRNSDGKIMGVRYMQMTALLVKGMQEQQQQINWLWGVLAFLSVVLFSTAASRLPRPLHSSQ